MLTQQEIESYRARGYLAVDGIFNTQTLARLRAVVDEFVENSRAIKSGDSVYDLEPGHSAGSPKVRRLKSPVRIHPLFDELMRSDAILDIIEPLIGPNIRYQGDKLNMKSAEFGSPVEWHQDFAFYPHTNDDLLAVGVAIDDCTLENGCLLVIPGSHKGPILDHHQDGLFVGAIDPGKKEADLDHADPVAVKAGGVSIHHVKALHGSAQNRSAKSRRLLIYQYAAADAWPLSGVSNLQEFDAKIVRGRPTLQARCAAMEVRIPLPLPPVAGTIYELQTNLRTPAFGSR